MTDIQRIIKIQTAFLSDICSDAGGDFPAGAETLRSLRIRYWYGVLLDRAGLSNATGLERYFEPESFVWNADGSLKYYRNKWGNYEKGKNLPRATLLKKVEDKYPGSTRELFHPLWSVLDPENKQVMLGDAFLRQLTPAVRGVVLITVQEGLQEREVRVPVTQLLLERLECKASLDVLACLTWLLREATEKQSVDAVSIGHALHNVMMMMALELYALKIAGPLFRLLLDNILPLGVPPYHRLCMSEIDYVHDSVYLNRMVYEVGSTPVQSLGWSGRVKMMNRLIKGDFGFDIYFAMRQQFDLDDTSGEIPVEIFMGHKDAVRYNSWGWLCILSGRKIPLKLFIERGC